MKEEIWVRCPCCGSLLTAPAFHREMWHCRTCYAVFPVVPEAKSEEVKPCPGF